MDRIYEYLIELGVFVVALVAAFFTGMKKQRNDAEKKQLLKSLEDAKDAAQIRKDMSRLSDADAERELRKHTRD